MPPVAFLALLTIILLALAAFRLELNFRRTCKEGPGHKPATSGPERRTTRPERRAPTPELRSAPAGGYWQAPFSGEPQARRAGFAL